jgi:hypothetical protein
MKTIRPVPQVFAVRQIIQCQGGFCESRAICAHYYAPGIPGRAPIDRLCPPGDDQPENMGVVGQLFPESKP